MISTGSAAAAPTSPNGAAPPRAVVSPDLLRSRLWASDLLSLEDREALNSAMVSRAVFHAGRDIVREGDEPVSVFLIVGGWAGRYTITKAGGRQFPAMLLPGDLANLDSLEFDRLDYGVRALSEVTTLTFSRDRLRVLAAESASIARAFARLAMIENTALSKLAQCIGRLNAKERVSHLLCELGARVGAEEHGGCTFPFPLTQEHIGDTLGLTAVHVNRTMQGLKRDGWIDHAHGTMTLRDLPSLRRLSAFHPAYLHLSR